MQIWAVSAPTTIRQREEAKCIVDSWIGIVACTFENASHQLHMNGIEEETTDSIEILICENENANFSPSFHPNI